MVEFNGNFNLFFINEGKNAIINQFYGFLELNIWSKAWGEDSDWRRNYGKLIANIKVVILVILSHTFSAQQNRSLNNEYNKLN